MVKRLLLLAILLFPIITLVAWFYWGFLHPKKKASPPAVQTNQVTPLAPAR